jgi:manganese/zinc/iron transport system substrate-binding protein
MRDADIIFYNGLYLEAQIKDALDGLDEKVVSVSDDIDRETLLAWDVDGADVPESESYDPHIWNDVSLWIDATYKVSDTLQERDPTQAETYEQNAQIYIAQLQELDEYARAQIATIPENRRYLISTHDAFSYFSRAYNIPTRALLGISTEAEASTQDVQELSDFIVENNIPAIFGENITSDKFAQSVLEAVEEKGHTVVIGPELLSDALGEEGSPQDSYEGMIRSNVDSIVNALTETE